MQFHSIRHRGGVRPSLLAMALAIGVGAAAPVYAQSTTGDIFGQVPATPGETIQVTGSNGVTRTVPVDAQGRYRVGNLPLGNYTVSLMRDGAVVDSRKDVP